MSPFVDESTGGVEIGMQLLIKRHTNTGGFKGDIVSIRASGTPFAGLEPDSFVLVEIPGTPMADYEQYARPWELLVDFAVVNQDLALDGFRIRLFSTNNNGPLGAVTRGGAETFINGWGGVVHSFAANEVVFDILIYDALTSVRFWEIDFSAVVFNEVSYDQGTGIHRIEADYSALGNSPTYVERFIARRHQKMGARDGFTIVSHANQVVTYDADRSIVRALFQADVAYKSRRRVAKKQFRVSDAVVDWIVGQGGTVESDMSTVAGYIQDKQAL